MHGRPGACSQARGTASRTDEVASRDSARHERYSRRYA